MKVFFDEGDIIVLDFPLLEWLPLVFKNIKYAEEIIEGLVIEPDQGIWSLDGREALIGETQFRYEGIFFDEMVGVFEPARIKNFNGVLSDLIENRKKIFLSIV
jgi:hypothetical protein